MLTRRGVELPKSGLTPSDVATIRRELTVSPLTYDQAFPLRFKVYDETPEAYIVPRFWATESLARVPVTDIRPAPKPVVMPFVGSLKQELRQHEAARAVMEHLDTTGGAVLALATGFGKCLSPDTPIVAYDGSIVYARDLRPGMKLMGIDSTPRTVLDIGKGTEMMYEIVPTKGEPWRCNAGHILCLQYTSQGRIEVGRGKYTVHWFNPTKPFGTKTTPFETIEEATAFAASLGDIIDMPLRDYLELPKSNRAYLKLFRTGPIDFPTVHTPTFDPYVIGAWLGDGTSDGPQFALADKDLVEEIERRSEGLRMIRRAVGEACPEYRLRSDDERKGRHNPFMCALRDYGMIKNKHIPHELKTGSRRTRLDLLAGLLDTDGFLFGNCFEIIQKNKRLAEDIVFVARSLGFAAYVRQTTKVCVHRDGRRTPGTYHRVSISGEGLEAIPTVLERKRARPRVIRKNARRTGFQVREIGEGEYVGPVLDGDHRYLLGCFTVTHNTTTALWIASQLGLKTVVVVGKEFLATQWESRIAAHIPSAKVTRVQGKTFDTSGDIVVAMLQTLSKRKHQGTAFDDFGLLIVDE